MQHHHFNIINRRDFLSTVGKAGIVAALSSITNVPGVLKRAMAEGTIGSGKKVLFIWLRGANDALNSVIPFGDRTAYDLARPDIRIPFDGLTNYGTGGIACDFPQAGSASTYGFYPNAVRLGNGFAALHPSLKFLAPVYNAGDLALIHRVGYPRQSRSHFDSQNYWENGNPNNNLSKDGIFYRTILESGLAGVGVTGVSIQSSLPLLLRGSEAALTNLTDPLRYNLLSIPAPTGDLKSDSSIATGNSAAFSPKMNRDLLRNQYAGLQQTLNAFAAINFTDSGNTFQDDVKTDGDTTWQPINSAGASTGDSSKGYFLFPAPAVGPSGGDTNNKNGGWRRANNSLDGNKYVINPTHQGFFYNLKAAALVLNHTSAIIAGTELGGFDTHLQQVASNGGAITPTLGNHADLQRVIGWSIYALRKYFSLYAANVSWNNLVVVTLSEFGRTTRENNDNGTDHAEASAMWVAGGAVKGYGKPGSTTGVFNCGPNDGGVAWAPGNNGSMFGISGSYLKRNTDYRSVLGEIIRKHLGATQAQLNRIIPGYANEAQEHLLSGGQVGSPIDNITTDIRGEVGIL
jgi:uncharacterized protein (DUF1501 family)